MVASSAGMTFGMLNGWPAPSERRSCPWPSRINSPSRASCLESWGKTTGRQEPKPKSDTSPSSLFRRPGRGLVAAVAAPVAAFIGLYATALHEAFPCITDRACQDRGLTGSPEPGPELRILPATLDRDGAGRPIRRVRKAGPRRSQHSHQRRLPTFH
jgi:hypothetical protein